MTTSPCHGKNGNIRLGAWTKQEDDKLIDHIKAHGTGNGCWSIIPKAAGLQRCGKSCRARWMNKLRPEMKRRDFCADEEELIIRLHALLGNRWSLIAGRLPGRSEKEVREYWNSHIKGKLVSLGIDPENHNVSQIPRCTENANSIIWNGESSSKQYLSKSLWGSKTSAMDDKEEVSSSDLNLDLTMAFHSSSSSPNCTAVKKKQPQLHVSDHELKVDIEADQDLEKHALILFR